MNSAKSLVWLLRKEKLKIKPKKPPLRGGWRGPMIIYNITINIDNSVHDEWLVWMREIYIPNAMNTGCFVENKLCKVLVNEEEGTTYSVQFTCKAMQDYETYTKEHASRMQQLASQYADKLVAFSTLLQVV